MWKFPFLANKLWPSRETRTREKLFAFLQVLFCYRPLRISIWISFRLCLLPPPFSSSSFFYFCWNAFKSVSFFCSNKKKLSEMKNCHVNNNTRTMKSDQLSAWEQIHHIEHVYMPRSYKLHLTGNNKRIQLKIKGIIANLLYKLRCKREHILGFHFHVLFSELDEKQGQSVCVWERKGREWKTEKVWYSTDCS